MSPIRATWEGNVYLGVSWMIVLSSERQSIFVLVPFPNRKEYALHNALHPGCMRLGLQ